MAKRTPEQLQVEQAKAERLAAALRDNLRRRKAQARTEDQARAEDLARAEDKGPDSSE